MTNKTIIEFAVHRECKREVSRRQKSVCNILNINIQEFDDRRIAFDASRLVYLSINDRLTPNDLKWPYQWLPFRLKHPLLFDNFGVTTKTAMTDDWPVSHQSGQPFTGYNEIRALYKKQDRPEQNENSTGKISIRWDFNSVSKFLSQTLNPYW